MGAQIGAGQLSHVPCRGDLSPRGKSVGGLERGGTHAQLSGLAVHEPDELLSDPAMCSATAMEASLPEETAMPMSSRCSDTRSPRFSPIREPP